MSVCGGCPIYYNEYFGVYCGGGCLGQSACAENLITLVANIADTITRSRKDDKTMAKIGLTEGFTLIPEGTHVFQITDVKYKEDFGKLEVYMQTQTGSKHIERFSLLKSDGTPNEGAYNAFSYFAKTALGNFDLTEIDHTDLIGHFIECDVEHDVQENKKKPGQNITFVRLADKRPSEGWGGSNNTVATPAAKTTPTASQAAPKTPLDLAALLG